MDIPEPYRSRFLARRDTSGGPDACWPWTHGLDSGGYGMGPIGFNRRDRSHRIAVMLDGRDIPPGMSVDHLCRNRACCNPRHLDVVPIGENVRRSFPFRERKTVCPKGHRTERPEDRTARGACRTCKNIAELAKYHVRQSAKPRPVVCKNGHPLDVPPPAGRNCRSCSHLGNLRAA